MKLVLLAALGVGGATVLGSVLGFIFKKISQSFGNIIMSFAAGVMLAAAVIGLVLPSLEYGGRFAPLVTVTGVFFGAWCLNRLDGFVPQLRKMAGIGEKASDSSGADRVLLFVMAIAIHNFPEGIAAGVGFGSGNTVAALTVAGGIALQNIPEGMVVIAPMLAAGISSGRTLVCALLTGFVEILGTLMGYYAVNLSQALLPFALSYAGGTMLYVISEDMIPQTHSGSSSRTSAFALLIGFCIMIVMDFYIK